MSRRTVLLALSLCGPIACRHTPPGETTETTETTETVAVSVATVSRATLSGSVTLSGRLVPPVAEDAPLAPQVAGRLVAVAVREGDAVRAGSLLATVDRRPLDEAVSTAAAALERARLDEAVRAKAAALTASLVEKGIASREERDADQAALEAAKAARVEAEGRLAQAKRQGDWSELRAPFAGVVGTVSRHPGELVDGTGATPVLRLLGTSSEELAADASAPDLLRLAAGQPASVRLAGRDEPVAGVVARVARAVDPSTGAGEVRVRLAVRSGAPLLSSATASIVVARRPDVLAVPVAALRRSEGGEEQVVAVESGKAHVVDVKTGVRSDGLVEIVEGLKGGENVVVDSPLGLADAAPVEVRKPAAR